MIRELDDAMAIGAWFLVGMGILAVEAQVLLWLLGR